MGNESDSYLDGELDTELDDQNEEMPLMPAEAADMSHRSSAPMITPSEALQNLDFGTLSLTSDANWLRQGRRPTETQHAYLTFLLGESIYGIELARLREIIKARMPTEVPRTPAFIAGIISLRGLIMPVVDLRVRLNLNVGQREATRCLVVVRGEERIGILVDQVLQVVTLGPHEIEATPMLARVVEEGLRGRSGAIAETERPAAAAPGDADGNEGTGRTQRGSEFISGIGRSIHSPEQLILLLDLDAILRFELRRRWGDST